jgi:(p)ppGpp synthase/HD superfamily hydrolase
MIKELVIRAYNFSKKAHEGQNRRFVDLDYFTHPKGVARIVEEFSEEPEIIAAALLHDVLEDTKISFSDLESEFGVEVAQLVDEMTNKKEERGNRKKKDYLREKMSKMSDDALLIKFADRLHNIQYLEHDSKNPELKSFAQYYYEATRYIMRDFVDLRKSNGLSFTEQHAILYHRIDSILDSMKEKLGL